MLYIGCELEEEDPEKVALRVIFGDDTVRVTRRDEEVVELLLAVDVEDLSVGTWNDEDEADVEGEGRLPALTWFAAEDVAIGTCKLALPRMHLRLRPEEDPAMLEAPEANEDPRD